MFEDLQQRPTRADLDTAFGFPVPEALGELLCHIYDTTGRLDDGHDGLFHRLTQMYLSDKGFRYDQTPPELFAFGRPGVDGIHFCFAIHDEQLGPDWPVVQFNPMNSAGATFVGANPRDGLASVLTATLRRNLRAEHTNQSEFDERRREVLAAAAALGLTLDESKPTPLDLGMGREPGSDNRLRRVLPKLPTGWKLLPTLDGLGVAAPDNAIHPDDRELQMPEFEDAEPDFDAFDSDEANELAAEWIDEYPASSLKRLRDLRITDLGSSDLIELMTRAYELLGRHLIAQNLRETT